MTRSVVVSPGIHDDPTIPQSWSYAHASHRSLLLDGTKETIALPLVCPVSNLERTLNSFVIPPHGIVDAAAPEDDGVRLKLLLSLLLHGARATVRELTRRYS